MQKKVIAIVGPTASGKSDFAVWLAKKINGEVISCDSRQVYRGLDIGSGKITKRQMRGVPHHLLSIASPKRTFTAQDYKNHAEDALKKIYKNGKIPIICGGTGFYLDTLLETVQLPNVPPNKLLRKKLEKKTVKELFSKLEHLDPRRAKSIDKNNKPRLIRALEIIDYLGFIPKSKKTKSPYDALYIGINIEKDILRKKIHNRLSARIKKGMFDEVERLHKKGLSWNRMEKLGLEYRYLARYFQNKLSYEETLEQLENAIWQYSKRQLTWFAKNKKITWLKPKNNSTKIDKLLKKFLQ